jgi:hypothetical protein
LALASEKVKDAEQVPATDAEQATGWVAAQDSASAMVLGSATVLAMALATARRARRRRTQRLHLRSLLTGLHSQKGRLMPFGGLD